MSLHSSWAPEQEERQVTLSYNIDSTRVCLASQAFYP